MQRHRTWLQCNLYIVLIALSAALWEHHRPAAAYITLEAAPAALKTGPGGTAKARLAVVNSRRFHLEVLAGVLEVVKPLAAETVVYAEEKVFGGTRGLFGFLEFVKDYTGVVAPLPRDPQRMGKFDMVFFISPE